MEVNFIKTAIIVLILGMLAGILIFTTHVFADDISCTPTITSLLSDVASPSATLLVPLIEITPTFIPTIQPTPTAGQSATPTITEPILPPHTGHVL